MRRVRSRPSQTSLTAADYPAQRETRGGERSEVDKKELTGGGGGRGMGGGGDMVEIHTYTVLKNNNMRGNQKGKETSKSKRK